ncbi:MAG TPA: SDR family oxidoreductase [Streptosporangiaceae bacterium]|nr:SDR family oxidoreductase [Streptosporangiaceae bacterium]
MRQDLGLLSDDCPSLWFNGKFADLEALNTGNAFALRPVLDEEARARLDSLPCHGTDTALVVGGNGFVGAHVVARLSRDPRIRMVLATVRASDGRDPRERLDETLRKYKVTDLIPEKIEVLDATPLKSGFGLPAARYRELAEDVDLVFGCATSNDYEIPYLGMRDDWFGSLLRLVQFVTEGKRKHLTYVGSVSAHFYRDPGDFRRPDSWWYSGYAQLKWVNGTVLRWLARDNLLPVTLCEAPHVLGATDLGLDPGKTYSWWRLVEIARSIGLFWKGPGMCYVPVDVLADALAVNALADRPLSYLLPRNPFPYDNELIADLLDLRLADWPQFAAEVNRQVSRLRAAPLVSEDGDALVRKINEPPTVMPPGYDESWCDNRRLYELYLSNIRFRDVRLGSYRR